MVDAELSRDGRTMRILLLTGDTTAVRAASPRTAGTTRSGQASSGPAARLTRDASCSVPAAAPSSTTRATPTSPR
jgi:hypothetical protein